MIKSKTKEWKIKDVILNLVFAIISVGTVALISAMFTDTTTTWYMSLDKPVFMPPAIIFPIVWTSIYIMFVFVIFWLCQNMLFSTDIALWLLADGVLNIIWCFVFFVTNSVLGGFIVILLNLVVAIVLNIKLFKVNKLCGYLCLLNSVWLTIATILNFSILLLN